MVGKAGCPKTHPWWMFKKVAMSAKERRRRKILGPKFAASAAIVA